MANHPAGPHNHVATEGSDKPAGQPTRKLPKRARKAAERYEEAPATATAMPAASGARRVKNTRISRHFIIGNEAWVLDPAKGPYPEGHTKGWRVYIRGLPNGPDVTVWLKKVQFKLHHTYSDASRTIEAPGPFEVAETGYGEFAVEMRLYFSPDCGEKAVYREHYLQLAPFGPLAQQEAQAARNLFVSERLEIVEFNEPQPEFFRQMVGDEQWLWLMTRRGRGKGKKAELVFEGEVEPTAQLPEVARVEGAGALGSGGVWSKQMEKQILEMVRGSTAMLDAMIEEERGKMEERQGRRAALGAWGV